MLIAVTGAFGFIGQEVVSRLVGRGHRLILVDYWDELIPRYEELGTPILESVYSTAPQAELLMRPEQFLTWLDGSAPDVIAHLGAVVDTADMGDSGRLFSSNVAFTRELVRKSNLGRLTHDVPGIVFASSAAVYGSKGFPNNPYGLTKALGERFVVETRGEFSMLRFFNVFGRNEHHKGPMASMPFKVAQAYRRGDRIDMHSLDSARDFVPVTSVAATVAAITETLGSRDLDEPVIRTVEDVGTGYATTFADLDNYIMQAMRNVTSCVREVSIPSATMGRYQHYTCAGVRAVNRAFGSQSTRDAIEEIYGPSR
jgi:ADP-L-glycero-D-manno-heptose 6-epimerase